jgi:hypothetical protein
VPSTDQDTTPPVSRYANARLEAMATRIAHLEAAIEAAVDEIDPLGTEPLGQIHSALMSALVDDFRSTLLCLPETTDEQLDHWLPEIEKHEAQAAESEAV